MADMRYVEPNRIITGIQAKAPQAEAKIEDNWSLYWKAGVPVCASLSAVTAIVDVKAGIVAAVGFLGAWGIGFLFKEYAISAARAGDPIARAGALGELAVLDELKRLPDDYIILNQVLLPDRHSSTGYREIDYVVIGPTGVFVLEAKSYNGFLSGAENDQEWTMLKVGRGGMPYTSSCRNPVRQLRVYIRLLSEALKVRGVRVWLNGVVVLAKDNDLSLIDVHSVGVVQVSALVDYLTAFKGQRVKDPAVVAMAIRGISKGCRTKIRSTLILTKP